MRHPLRRAPGSSRAGRVSERPVRRADLARASRASPPDQPAPAISSSSPRRAAASRPPGEAIARRTTWASSIGLKGFVTYAKPPTSTLRRRSLASARAVRKTMGMAFVASSARRRASDLPAVEAGHHDVEDDGVGRLAPDELDSLRAVRRLEDLDPLRLEIHAAQHADRRLVVDHEHARLRHPP